MPRRRSGHTLVELAVATFLLGLLVALTGTFFRHALAHHRRTMRAVELQEDALATLGRLSTLVSESHRATAFPALTSPGPLLPPAGSPTGLILASPRDQDGRLRIDGSNGLPLWQRWVCVWHDATASRLMECSEDLATPSSVLPTLESSQDLVWFSTTRSPQRPLPGRVSAFSLNLLPTMATVRIDLRVQHAEVPGYGLELTTRASFRSGGP